MAQKILIIGASRGIGLEMAKQSQATGHDVVATARNDAGLSQLSDAGVQAVQADIVEEASLAAAAAQVSGPIDLLICNAGIYRGRGDLSADDLGADAWSDVLMTNAAGPFLAVQAFLPKISTDGGKIAIISSIMGSSAKAAGNGYIYRASKAAATNIAANLAIELAPRGIYVGAYHPGWVRTDMGGPSAAVSIEDSASGLLNRFQALGAATSGVLEDFEGTPIPF